MARKNATFTLDKTYGSGHGDRSLIHYFYARLNGRYPDDTPIPIPPESQIHPQHDTETQTFIFADFAIRKIAPIALRAVGLTQLAAALEQLDPITNKKTAAVASDRARAVAAVAAKAQRDLRLPHGAFGAADAAFVGAYYVANPTDVAARAHRAFADAVVGAAASAVANAAELDPDATWAAVNEMLQAL